MSDEVLFSGRDGQLPPQNFPALVEAGIEYAHVLGVNPPAENFFDDLVSLAENEGAGLSGLCELSSGNFAVLLAVAAAHEDTYGEGSMNQLISTFASQASAGFVEPSTSEDEMTHTARRVEKTVSTYIEENGQLGVLELLSEKDLRQLMEIYRPDNLLFLATQLLDETGQIPQENIDMLYRYRIVVQRLSNCFNALVDSSLTEAPKEPKDGSRTWAGDVHPYGHRTDGRIVGSEHRAFSEAEDEPGVSAVTVDGVVIAVGHKGIGLFYE